MAELFSSSWWQIVLAGIATLAIFSFLIKENSFYRLFEHLFIGVATAVGIMSSVRFFILPDIIDPLFGLDIITYPDGTPVTPYNSGNLLLVIPMIFGSFYYFILSRRLSWLAQIVIGFMLGVGAGNAFRAILNESLPQLKDSFKPLYVPGDSFASLTNAIFIYTLICSMIYFFFTFKREEGGVISRYATRGRYLMMCCFGAFFGSTIMARMALLVERLEFLLNKFFPALSQIWS
jgi:hypothetical protein